MARVLVGVKRVIDYAVKVNNLKYVKIFLNNSLFLFLDKSKT